MTFTVVALESINEITTKCIKISDGKILYIGTELNTEQKKQLLSMVQEHSGAFTSDYLDMKGIHPDTCIHHIYTNYETKPLRQSQRHMNLALKEIVKEELQKLLTTDFIYPISDRKWISPLVVVPKKNGKWCIFVIPCEIIFLHHLLIRCWTRSLEKSIFLF